MRGMKGVVHMEMAKVTSKGQITIPVSIRRRLGINEGDKLLFIDQPEGVMMVNPDMLPGGQYAEDSEFGIRNSELKDGGTKKAPPTPKRPAPEASSPPKEPEKPGQEVQGVDLSTLLSEIRSIGSKI